MPQSNYPATPTAHACAGNCATCRWVRGDTTAPGDGSPKTPTPLVLACDPAMMGDGDTVISLWRDGLPVSIQSCAGASASDVALLLSTYCANLQPLSLIVNPHGIGRAVTDQLDAVGITWSPMPARSAINDPCKKIDPAEWAKLGEMLDAAKARARPYCETGLAPYSERALDRTMARLALTPVKSMSWLAPGDAPSLKEMS